MDVTRKRTRTPAAGAATDFSLSVLPALGTSNAQGARQTTSPAEDVLIEQLLASDKIQHGPLCSVGKALKAMDETRRGKFVFLLDQSDRSNGEIAQVFEALGYEGITHHMVGHHRKRLRNAGCKCQK